MISIAHDVIDCTGFEIIMSLPWDPHEGCGDDHEDKHRSLQRTNWGFLVCRLSASSPYIAESYVDGLYGAVGESLQTGRIETPCLGILLQGTPDPQTAMSHFVLACGLSVIDKAKLELGDTLVVAGANPLAIGLLVAADQQGVRTVCVTPEVGNNSDYLLAVKQVVKALITFTFHPSFDSQLDAFIESSRGKTVYVDTVGLPNLVYSMVSRLKTFGTLVLCRQDSANMAQVDILHDIHRKSAQIIYWTRPENLEGGLALNEYYRRATRLFQWKRVTMVVPGVPSIDPWQDL